TAILRCPADRLLGVPCGLVCLPLNLSPCPRHQAPPNSDTNHLPRSESGKTLRGGGWQLPIGTNRSAISKPSRFRDLPRDRRSIARHDKPLPAGSPKVAHLSCPPSR